MEYAEYAPVISALFIIVAAVLVGPVFGIPADSSDGGGCSVDAPIGTGNASVSVRDLPDRAVIERMDFGSELYQLRVEDAAVAVDDVRGRPTVAYKLRVDLTDGARAIGSTAILSRCHDTTSISIEDSSLEPDRVENESYDGTLTVTYRGSRDGEDVENELAVKNVTVEVRE